MSPSCWSLLLAVFLCHSCSRDGAAAPQASQVDRRDATDTGAGKSGATAAGTTETEAEEAAVFDGDTHSYSRPERVRVKHARLALTLDFAKQVMAGSVTLELVRTDPDAPLILDVNGLVLNGAFGKDGKARKTELGAADKWRGQSLTIDLEPGDDEVRIRYRTAPDSKAVQWLSPEQTFSRMGPYVYTQGEAILTRSWIPLQDSPGVRMTYEATIKAPKPLRVVMSANVREEKGNGEFHFKMDKPIPSYLIALACGRIEFAKLSDRCGVFADPAFLPMAKDEFADTEKMLQKCEAAFGPYVWGRYDILVLPPAFPFGGMENPTLTFATPTIVAGDKSLVALIAHELAHSWSGNLVTNATWNDFWLNEGFTVFLEQRIMELVYGRDRAELEIATAVAGLRKEVAELPARDTHLWLHLEGRDPDEGMTAIAYDKGAAFLRRLEQVFGRAAFDEFLQGYFKAHRFQSITTEQFVVYLDKHLLQKYPKKREQVDVQRWIYGPGLPATLPVTVPKAFAAVDKVAKAFLATAELPDDRLLEKWSFHEWLHFLDRMPSRYRSPPGDLTAEMVQHLEARLMNANAEVRCRYLVLMIENGVEAAYLQAGEFLDLIGRRKFVAPIFRALVRSQSGKAFAQELFQRIKGRLHSITRNTVREILN